VIACEHQNFLSGPNEVYHLSVVPVGPDFGVALAFDRGEAAAGGSTGVFATVTRLNGFAGPVELAIDGESVLGGKIAVPPNQQIAFVPLTVKDGTKTGGYVFRVKATASIGGTTVTRYGTLTDAVKANLAGMTNPPAEMINQCAFGVIEKLPVAVKFTAEPATIEKGKTGKIVVDATRSAGSDADIALAPLFVPPTVVPAVKPIPKGQTKGEIGLTVQPPTPVGATSLVFRVSTKVGGKDYAFVLPAVTIDVVEPKKEEPKKDAPKKEEPKKGK
jgi:hypothetical protein